jgi:hypothetical protein
MELDLDVKRLMADIRKETSADVIRQIQLRVALHRQDLYYHFSRLDKSGTGTIGLDTLPPGALACGDPIQRAAHRLRCVL